MMVLQPILFDMHAFFWIEKLIALAVLFQTIELLLLRESLKDTGVWSWKIIRREFQVFPGFISRGLDFSLRYPNFLALLGLRTLAAVLLLVHSTPGPQPFRNLWYVTWPFPELQMVVIVFLFVSTILISLRWRGTFNGGSDFMTLIILMALSIAAFSSSSTLRTGCLWYITVQTCTSYFIAGFVKLKSANWRSGRALQGFLESTIYRSDFLTRFLKRPLPAILASWTVIAFECSFPLALLSPQLCIPFLFAALAFHLGTFYLFGLNRFVFAWLAAYPAVYYCSQLR